jgi:hypothetical protein
LGGGAAFRLLSQVCRDWYFLAGLAVAAAPLAAIGLDRALKAKRPPMGLWAAPAAAGLLLAWSVRQIAAWSRGGLATGWMSALELGVTLSLCALAIYVLPAQKGIPRAVLAAALLAAVGVDYKVYGTSSRVNAAEGRPFWDGRVEPLPAMHESVYWRLREHREYRVAVDLTAPWPQSLRHHGLRSPQGHDSFIPRQYRELMEGLAHFRNQREIELDPANEAALRLLGVRYFITSEQGPLYPQISTSPIYRLVEPSPGYYKVFEYLHARPPYGWDSGEGSADQVANMPERRAFRVRSPTGGRFTLAEQHFPGWRAAVDGKPVPIERWRGAFQAVEVPPGEHEVEFRYRAPGLAAGAWISLVSILLGMAALLRRR